MSEARDALATAREYLIGANIEATDGWGHLMDCAVFADHEHNECDCSPARYAAAVDHLIEVARLAALPDGWTLARTQDAKDGEALRLLREALNDGGGYPIEVRWWTSPPQDDWQLRVIRPRVFVNSGNHPTIAEAADACREAVTR